MNIAETVLNLVGTFTNSYRQYKPKLKVGVDLYQYVLDTINVKKISNMILNTCTLYFNSFEITLK